MHSEEVAVRVVSGGLARICSLGSKVACARPLNALKLVEIGPECSIFHSHWVFFGLTHIQFWQAGFPLRVRCRGLRISFKNPHILTLTLCARACFASELYTRRGLLLPPPPGRVKLVGPLRTLLTVLVRRYVSGPVVQEAGWLSGGPWINPEGDPSWLSVQAELRVAPLSISLSA